MAEEEAKQEGTEGEEGKKSNNMLMWIIIGIIIVLEIPIMWVIISVTRPKSPEEIAAKARADSLKVAAAQKTSIGATTVDAPLEAIVNIAGTEGQRFLKVVLIFEYDDVRYPGLAEELGRRAPVMKSQLIDLLSKLTLMEVNDPNVKDRIKSEFMRIVNASLPTEIGQINKVLIDQFIVQ